MFPLLPRDELSSQRHLASLLLLCNTPALPSTADPGDAADADGPQVTVRQAAYPCLSTLLWLVHKYHPTSFLFPSSGYSILFPATTIHA